MEADPLYPSRKEAPGFRALDGTELTAESEEFTFTKSAADASELFMKPKKR